MLNDKERLVVRKLLKILSSLGVDFSYQNNPKLCDEYSDILQQCTNVRVFWTSALFQTKTNPCIYQLSTIDRQNNELEFEWFIVQTDAQIVFRAMFPKPGFGLEPMVIYFVDGSWLDEIDDILILI